MIDEKNTYTEMQKKFYDGGTSDHLEHDANIDYWNILLEKIKDKDNSESLGLDFGCGKGRNVRNLKKFNFKRVDGVDISTGNINDCRSKIPDSLFYLNNGVNLSEIEDETYNFVMSTIVFQHIPVHDIRYQLLGEILRVLKPGGLLSFQMGMATEEMKDENFFYFANNYTVPGTNGQGDVQIKDKKDLIEDLLKIGFTNIETMIRPSFSDNCHKEWIYVHCEKNK